MISLEHTQASLRKGTIFSCYIMDIVHNSPLIHGNTYFNRVLVFLITTGSVTESLSISPLTHHDIPILLTGSLAQSGQPHYHK